LIAHLNRRYHLSASHRLHSLEYDEATNRAVFGKCNNPFGHGHNYIVQVTMSGEVDAVTGMVCNLAELDAFAAEHLVARFDHQNLNTVDPFDRIVPSTENFAIEIYRIFQPFSHAHLERVHVEETGNNSFDYAGQ
jgi:6-pyruvoyltetrahydropterin/6-carboxytetrahydropterin synthase